MLALVKSQETTKSTKNKSLKTVIFIAYTILATLNLLFFSIVILENQTDLIIDNFSLFNEKFANSLREELESVTILDSKDEEGLINIKNILNLKGIENYNIRDQHGLTIAHSNMDDSSTKYGIDYKNKIDEWINKQNIPASGYIAQADYRTGRVEYIFELSQQSYFLHISKTYSQIIDGIKSIIIQLLLILFWAIVIHIGFGIFLSKKIFSRLNSLQQVTQEIEKGDYSLRVQVSDISKVDEIDSLSKSFNFMVDATEQTLKEVKELNRQIQAELRIGKDVQSMMLPSKEILSKFSPEIYFQPMREVSGDIYSFIDFGNGKYKGIFIADATGHGVSAALVTAILNMSLKAVARRTANPAKIINAMCLNLFEIMQCEFFASAVFLLIDENNKMYYSNAAHNPQLLFKKDKVLELESNGSLLGLMEFSTKEVKMVQLEPGDKILLYTDGVTECANSAKEQFTLERLRELTKEHISKENKEIIEILKNEITEFAHEFNDDVTLILFGVPADV